MTATIIQFPVVPRPRPVPVVQAITTAEVAPAPAAAPASSKFEVGKTYKTSSLCDSECIYSFTILKRTAKRMTFTNHGETVTRGVWVGEDGVERCKPHGTYSMCAVIRADKAGEVY